MNLMVRILATAVLMVLASEAFAGPNCTCRFGGQNYRTGDIMCIRGKLQRCEFVLNNTSWKVIATTCPQVNGQSIRKLALQTTQKTD